MSAPSLVVFGAQTEWPSAEYLDQLRSKLLSDGRLHDLVTAITELPTLTLALTDQNPSLTGSPALRISSSYRIGLSMERSPSPPSLPTFSVCP
jgi:hypothetical protein